MKKLSEKAINTTFKASELVAIKNAIEERTINFNVIDSRDEILSDRKIVTLKVVFQYAASYAVVGTLFTVINDEKNQTYYSNIDSIYKIDPWTAEKEIAQLKKSLKREEF